MEKKSLFDIFRQNAKKIYKKQGDVERVIEIINKSEEESKQKQIIIVRQTNAFKKFLVRWQARLKYGIHWKKRFYIFRLIRNYSLQAIYNLLGINKFVFRGIEFGLTFNCNFKCSHCLCSRIDETDTRKELTPEEYGDICRQAMKLGALTFGLEGGEPFVYKEWDKVIEQLQPHYNHIEISTNGYMLDEKMVKKCAEMGVDTFNISLDSGIPELHNVFRKKADSFEKVMKAIEFCEKYGIKVILNTVIHRANLYTSGLIKLFQFAQEKRLLMNILFAKTVGTFKDTDSLLTDEDFENFFKIANQFDYWHIHHMGDLKSNHGKEGCSGVKEFVNMTPYGDMINCANCHVYLGNVRKESFASIRDRALKESPFGRYRPCFLTRDKDFMKIYYPILEDKIWVSLDEFKAALKEYEKKNNKKVYPEL